MFLIETVSCPSFKCSERDSLTVSTLACHAAGPGSNLGEDDLKIVPRSFFGYGAVGWETIAGRLSGLWIVEMWNVDCDRQQAKGTSWPWSMKHENMKHCRNSPIESRISWKSRVRPGLGQKVISGGPWLKMKTITIRYYVIIILCSLVSPAYIKSLLIFSRLYIIGHLILNILKGYM